MAVFSVEIADADVQRVLDALAANYKWSETVSNPDYPTNIDNALLDENGSYEPPVDENGVEIPVSIDNPESKAGFANRMVRRFLSDHVVSHERATAKKQALDALDTNITIDDPQV
jgi:hypothetical protein